MIEKWLEIGRANPWIRYAVDPPFTRQSFKECESPEELASTVVGSMYALGQAFYYRDVCLIQQIDGGGEYLIVKGDVPFESFSVDVIGTERLAERIRAMSEATPEQCRSGEYLKRRDKGILP